MPRQKGFKHSIATIEKIRQSKIGQPGYWKNKTQPTKGIARPKVWSENSPNWKGNMAKYKAIHMWVSRHRGKASNKKCAYCDRQASEWSNIDHLYRRDFSDYVPSCKRCHIKHDKKLTLTPK
jgi:hypothetical protein